MTTLQQPAGADAGAALPGQTIRGCAFPTNCNIIRIIGILLGLGEGLSGAVLRPARWLVTCLEAAASPAASAVQDASRLSSALCLEGLNVGGR